MQYGKKPALISAAFDAAFARAAGGEPVFRSSSARRASPCARASVPASSDGYTALRGQAHGHLAASTTRVREASMNDEEARAFFEKTSAIRRRGADTIVADVARARRSGRASTPTTRRTSSGC